MIGFYKKNSGDGYLSTWDIRKPDVAAMSDQMDDELLSVSIVKVLFFNIMITTSSLTWLLEW
jgi:hypothetical protein